MIVTRFLRRILVSYFFAKSQDARGKADYCLEHFSPGTFGYEIGELEKALANLWRSMAKEIRDDIWFELKISFLGIIYVIVIVGAWMYNY